jgi:phage/plasmid primase-like uncharacterized protein
MTFRSGSPGGVAQAAAYVAHLLERTIPEDQEKLADYYARLTAVDQELAAGLGSVPRPQEAMNPDVARALGIDPSRPLSARELGNVLGGLRADGEVLPGSQREVRTYQPKVRSGGSDFWDGVEEAATEGKVRNRNAWTDICLSAPKSVSVAWFAASTEGERAGILQAHRDAVQEALRYIEKEVAWAGFGAGSRQGDPERGKIGFITIDHFTSRPTVELVRKDPTTGVVATELYSVQTAGDPQLHTHAIMPNLMVTDSGRVMSVDGGRIAGRIHEFGAVYQAILARNLRSMGIEVALDPKTGMAMLPAIPQEVSDEFSKRTNRGVQAAAEYASRLNLDWAGLSTDQKAAMLKAAIKEGRQGKGDDLANTASWRQQLEEVGQRIGWKYGGSAMAYGPPAPEKPGQERIREAAWAALPHLEAMLQKSAGVTGTDVRLVAARGLIAKGMKTTDEVSEVSRELALHGVRQKVQTGRNEDSRWTKLLWVGGDRARPERVKVTTALHRDQELELIRLAKAGADSDRGGLNFFERAWAMVNNTKALNPEQSTAFHALGGRGLFAVAIGGAGVGKTTMLEPLVAAWKADGREVWGTALAWRQANALRDAGIDGYKTWALDPLLDDMRAGKKVLNEKSVVVLDELGQIGTLQLLQLLRFQNEQGFKLVAVGDDRQCQAIDAGPTIDLLRKALGNERIPEVLTTIRQSTEEERGLVKLFREGKISEALDQKRAKGHAELAPGGYDDAVKAIAERWRTRMEEGKQTKGYTVSVTAATNMEAFDIGRQIREIRRGWGEVHAMDAITLKATDNAGNAYDMPVAVGDKVRLFSRTRGLYGGSRNVEANVGDNGSILEVMGVRPDPEKGGLLLKTMADKVAFVPWENLAKSGDRIKLTYGDAVTIDTAQGMTSDWNVFAMANGSRGVTLFKAHVGASRHRVGSDVIGSMGVELHEIELKRPLGEEPMTEAQKVQAAWENVARNLGRQPLKESALAILGKMQQHSADARRIFQQGTQRREEAQQRGIPASGLRRGAAEQGMRRAVERVAEQLELNLKVQQKAVEVVSRQPPSRDTQTSQGSPNDRQAPKPVVRLQISMQEAHAQFTQAARDFGLVVERLTIDGERHAAPVLGRNGRTVKGGGAYKAFYDGGKPNIIMWNYKEGRKDNYFATGTEYVAVSPEELARREAEVRAAREANERARQQREDGKAAEAQDAVKGMKPATLENPYLARKGFTEVPPGLLEDKRGNLVVPMNGATGLRNLQTILREKPAEGTDKLYLKDAQKSGTGFLIGKIEPGKPIGIAEGLASGYSANKLSGLPVLVAWDTSNLRHIALLTRQRFPDSQIAFFADNDHHLPERQGGRLPNAGVKYATEAAELVGNAILVTAPKDPERHKQKVGTDWNDRHVVAGFETARKEMDHAIHSAPVIERSDAVMTVEEREKVRTATPAGGRQGPRMRR